MKLFKATLKEVFITKKEEFECVFDNELEETYPNRMRGISLGSYNEFSKVGMNDGEPIIYYDYDKEEYYLSFVGDACPNTITIEEDNITIKDVILIAENEILKYQKNGIDIIFNTIKEHIESYDDNQIYDYANGLFCQYIINYCKDNLPEELEEYIYKWKSELDINTVWTMVDNFGNDVILYDLK